MKAKRNDKEDAKRYRWLKNRGWSYADDLLEAISGDKTRFDAAVDANMKRDRAERKQERERVRHAMEMCGPQLPVYAFQWGTPLYRALELARFNAADERGEVKYGRGL